MVQINMSIPESCAECRLSVRHFGKLYCPPLNDRVGNEGKDARCPLVDAEGRGDMISRQEVLNVLEKLQCKTCGTMANYAVLDAIGDVANLPSAQPEVLACGEGELIAQPEIIHCKDCKYYTPVMAHCEIRGKSLYLIRGMEDFCSRAERRTDE